MNNCAGVWVYLQKGDGKLCWWRMDLSTKHTDGKLCCLTDMSTRTHTNGQLCRCMAISAKYTNGKLCWLTVYKNIQMDN